MDNDTRKNVLEGMKVVRKRADDGDQYAMAVVKSYDELPKDQAEEFLETYRGFLITAKLTDDAVSDAKKNKSSRVRLGKIVERIHSGEVKSYQQFYEEAKRIVEEE